MKYCVSLLLVILFLSPNLSIAKDTISICHGNGGYPPYHYWEDEAKTGEMKGISIEIVKEIFKSMSQPVHISALPWKRCYGWVKKGQNFQIIADGSYKKVEKNSSSTAKECTSYTLH